jgi:hypothetical protein
MVAAPAAGHDRRRVDQVCIAPKFGDINCSKNDHLSDSHQLLAIDLTRQFSPQNGAANHCFPDSRPVELEA